MSLAADHELRRRMLTSGCFDFKSNKSYDAKAELMILYIDRKSHILASFTRKRTKYFWMPKAICQYVTNS